MLLLFFDPPLEPTGRGIRRKRCTSLVARGKPAGRVPVEDPAAPGGLDPDAVLLEGEIERPVPTGAYPPGHLLLVGAVQPRRLRGLGVARLLGQPLQELVGGYLQVLRGVAVSRVLARLVAPGLVAHALQERRSHRLSLLARRSAAPQGVQPLTHAPLVLLGLAPVLLEHTLDLGV